MECWSGSITNSGKGLFPIGSYAVGRLWCGPPACVFDRSARRLRPEAQWHLFCRLGAILAVPGISSQAAICSPFGARKLCILAPKGLHIPAWDEIPGTLDYAMYVPLGRRPTPQSKTQAGRPHRKEGASQDGQPRNSYPMSVVYLSDTGNRDENDSALIFFCGASRMPAKNIRVTCEGCDGAGEIDRDVCTFCHGGEQDSLWFRFITRCPVCQGRNFTSQECRSCSGEGFREIRVWLPDTVTEVFETIEDLEDAIKEGYGAWRLIDSIQEARLYCDSERRDQLFPPHLVLQIDEIIHRLPPRCPACDGRGTASNSAFKCTRCNGVGLRRQTP